MDIFSLASNIQQIALGGVHFVNSKLRKKNSFTKTNYVSYIVIGEKENIPHDINIFFLPFANMEQMRLRQFKEYFPFKENVIFRFKLLLKDLVDVINDGLRNKAPLLKKNYLNDSTTEEYMIMNENEMNNILKQDNLNYIWVDVTNDDAFIPLCHGRIMCKVLFIHKEMYREFDQIYYNTILKQETEREPEYIMNDKHLYSYHDSFLQKKEIKNNCNEIDENDSSNSKQYEKTEHTNFQTIPSHLKSTESKESKKTEYSQAASLIKNQKEVEDPIGKYAKEKVEETNQNDTNSNRQTHSNLTISQEKESKQIRLKNSNLGLNIDNDDQWTKNNSQESNFQNKSVISSNNSETHSFEKEHVQLNNFNFENESKEREMNKMATEESRRESSEKELKTNINNRLKEIQESRRNEENISKEKVVLSKEIKQQIDKWSKNSDDTYKDIKVMLCTLTDVLWDGADWKKVSMSQLMNNPKNVKLFYKSAILLCHPDRHRNKSIEQMLKAELIFQALNNSYKLKRNI